MQTVWYPEHATLHRHTETMSADPEGTKPGTKLVSSFLCNGGAGLRYEESTEHCIL